MEAGTVLRIGELSRRSGVSPELLRAWERRYGLLHPMRSAGGLRLYSFDDLERVRLMRENLSRGVAAAEAAGLALRAASAGASALPAFAPVEVQRHLAAALDAFDEPGAQAVVDTLLSATTVDAALTDVVLPYLHELGERWRRGEATIAQEHFASTVLRGRLLGLARGWGRGFGPLALLACLPGEQHELGLIAFGLALRARGWRIAYVGSDTPLETIAATARSVSPDVVVLNAVTDDRVRPLTRQLRKLGATHRLALGGGGATESAAARVGAVALSDDIVAAAEQVSALVASDA